MGADPLINILSQPGPTDHILNGYDRDNKGVIFSSTEITSQLYLKWGNFQLLATGIRDFDTIPPLKKKKEKKKKKRDFYI